MCLIPDGKFPCCSSLHLFLLLWDIRNVSISTLSSSALGWMSYTLETQVLSPAASPHGWCGSTKAKWHPKIDTDPVRSELPESPSLWPSHDRTGAGSHLSAGLTRTLWPVLSPAKAVTEEDHRASSLKAGHAGRWAHPAVSPCSKPLRGLLTRPSRYADIPGATSMCKQSFFQSLFTSSAFLHFYSIWPLIKYVTLDF